tara:strand:- start:1828 stop:4863 length:3036 start_codon:yes stop_codon:yes gene_type:complete
MNGDSEKITTFLKTKKSFFNKLILKTIKAINNKKYLRLFSNSDVKVCLNELSSIQTKINNADTIEELQIVNNKMSTVMKDFGTLSLQDLISVCYGNTEFDNNDKYCFLCENFIPTGYNVIKENLNYENLHCDEVEETNNLHMKVNGIHIYFHDTDSKKMIIVKGYLEDIPQMLINNSYITKRKEEFANYIKQQKIENSDILSNFSQSITMKEYLLFSSSKLFDLFEKYNQVANHMQAITIMTAIKEYSNSDMFHKRIITMSLLINSNNVYNQYLAYLLYDILNTEGNMNIDNSAQTELFDSLPYFLKQIFKNTIKNTLTKIDEIANIDESKIPIEQQICLLKTSDNVKEKAMQKFKEIKSKSEDSGSKSRQYLDGLMKIPFSVYKENRITKLYNQNSNTFYELHKHLVKEYGYKSEENLINDKMIFSEICQQMKVMKDFLISKIDKPYMKNANNAIIKRAKQIVKEKQNLTLTKPITKSMVIDLISNNEELKREAFDKCEDIYKKEKDFFNTLENTGEIIQNDIKNITEDLGNAIHGHDNAKRQIERIIAQWINGNNSGYCLGFEGPPGIGKTSLAKKGIAKCLKDENNCPRPFSFIALGGSSNASTIDGHNYTYVGSTWGKIVDILMDSKCMNPIIFIDELDKVSKSEQGKEIIGVLTHLTDYTQNDGFQDKYFTGINLDLSKALFIFSYNDVNNIDKILLDRIHRIKFDIMTISDKIVIVKQFIFPELCERVGLVNKLHIDDDTITYIIDSYTYEPGVRKLREILFEIVGEINVIALKNEEPLTFPMHITKEDVINKYLKNHNIMIKSVIHKYPTVGLINGLWANSLSQGGILPIQVSHYPSNTNYDLKLTGMQGDVMKESMNVAKSLSFKLLKKIDNIDICTTEKDCSNNLTYLKKAIHIHCPDGATPKDGPSAGTAITLAIYSLLSNKKINNDVAITGEINLFGKITAIGGLDLKILGAYKANVKTLIYPEENLFDFNKFIEKHEYVLEKMNFVSCSSVYDIIHLVL